MHTPYYDRQDSLTPLTEHDGTLRSQFVLRAIGWVLFTVLTFQIVAFRASGEPRFSQR